MSDKKQFLSGGIIRNDETIFSQIHVCPGLPYRILDEILAETNERDARKGSVSPVAVRISIGGKAGEPSPAFLEWMSKQSHLKDVIKKALNNVNASVIVAGISGYCNNDLHNSCSATSCVCYCHVKVTDLTDSLL